MTRRATLLLWTGVLAAPLAWAAQLVAGYALEEGACPDDGVVEPLLVAVSAVCAVAAAGGLAAAWWSLRAVDRGGVRDLRGRVGFMAFLGILASALFLLAIVMSGVQVATLEPCTP